MTQFLLVFLGAGIGGAGRYAVSLALMKANPDFPWATLVVNLVGCLLIGFGAILLNTPEREPYRLLLLVGVLGGFTTFSSFSIETLNLWQSGHTTAAVVYVLMSNLLGIGFAALGYFVACRTIV